ncbi:hypothetical protein PAXRUDRAFT_788586 [Paxillus rubicundulus Ve08.2h10]|uniref:Unplaced genomic scaffold scaffold_37, whole genome shotgun sequence n=1 Tax=Paxillus rubicundulus Ve08.2h10 TaxID=930991 RepID=A0A0D0ECI9_9AGAM|nr:hypothetical protein PAXRUDRAFT_788586 [Paxillus rubicundulus Ve08.2h10]
MEEAASLVENILGVVLQPPSEDNTDTFKLLTPQALHRVRHHSGDSPSGLADLPKRKRGKKKATDQPSPSPILSAPSRSPQVLLRVPPHCFKPPPLASILEHLASHTSPPVIDAPPVSVHETYCCTIFAHVAIDLDLRNSYIINCLWRILAEVAPDVDFTDLLKSPPLDLPDPNTCILLPGLRLTSSTPSFVHSVPSQPELLDGHTLALPSWVINAMKNNWNVHIPLTALSTCSLTSLSLSTHEESGQALSLKDCVISLASSQLSAKDEGSLTAQEWLHAFPCLVDCICCHLPSPECPEITDLWLQHYSQRTPHLNNYNTISQCPDLWDLFHICLCYDICLHVHYVNPQNSLNPAVQSGTKQLMHTIQALSTSSWV